LVDEIITCELSGSKIESCFFKDKLPEDPFNLLMGDFESLYKSVDIIN